MLTIHWEEMRGWVLQKAETGEKRKAFHRHFAKSNSTFVRVDVRLLYSLMNTVVAFGFVQDQQATPTNTSN